MARLSQRAGNNRLAIIAGISAAMAAAWFLLGDHGISIIDETTVDANVVEVLIGRDSGDAARSSAGIVVVELPGGGRARLFVPAAQAVTGAVIRLTVKRYSDGSREVVAIANDNTAETAN
jgi:hypothetical protein